MQTFVVNNPKADPVDDVANAANAIRQAGWWASSTMPEHWPLSTDEAAQLLNESGEYDIDASELADLVDRRILSRPGVDENGSFEWMAIDVVTASGELEFRGQYRPAPSGNDCKKHPCQIALEAARQAGELDSIVNGEFAPRWDLTHLLAMLTRCPNEEGRIKVATLLKASLEVEHGVLIR